MFSFFFGKNNSLLHNQKGLYVPGTNKSAKSMAFSSYELPTP